jgi:hypothetical protein
MYHYPADIYTEPEPDTDTDTLANLGPGCARSVSPHPIQRRSRRGGRPDKAPE